MTDYLQLGKEIDRDAEQLCKGASHGQLPVTYADLYPHVFAALLAKRL